MISKYSQFDEQWESRKNKTKTHVQCMSLDYARVRINSMATFFFFCRNHPALIVRERVVFWLKLPTSCPRNSLLCRLRQQYGEFFIIG